jgi:hypothetical protein
MTSSEGYNFENTCPKCGKPRVYVGDPIENLDRYICTCFRRVGETYTIPEPFVEKQSESEQKILSKLDEIIRLLKMITKQ